MNETKAPRENSPQVASYRKREIERLMRAIRAGDSCSVVGVSGVAKSNLFRHLLAPEVRQHYLGDVWQSYLFLAVDSHALSELSERAVHDFLLERLAEEARERGADEETVSRVETLHKQVLGDADCQAWQRACSRSIAAVMTVDSKQHLVVLFDQFDEVYKTLSPRFFANLRAIRDEYKYRVSYVTFTRDELPRLRQGPECEELYELLSPNVIGLGPYNRDDSWLLLRRVAGRYGVAPDPDLGSRLIHLTAGHPGLLKAAYMSTVRGDLILPEADPEASHALLIIADVRTECQKLWAGLAEDEREVLSDLVWGFQLSESGREVLELLQRKGLVTVSQSGTVNIFCDLFRAFVEEFAPPKAKDLKLDRPTGRVWVEGKALEEDLTRLEFALLCYLDDRRGEVCTRDEIINALYPDEVMDPDAGIQDSRVDTVIGRVRDKVEPDRGRPRYILTVHGRGYRLSVGESGPG